MARSCRDGEASPILSIRTGWVLIQERKTSWMSIGFASVFNDPAQAWDRETLCPALSNADLLGLGGNGKSRSVRIMGNKQVKTRRTRHHPMEDRCSGRIQILLMV